MEWNKKKLNKMYFDKNHIHSLIYFIFIHKTIYKHYPYLKF